MRTQTRIGPRVQRRGPSIPITEDHGWVVQSDLHPTQYTHHLTEVEA